MPAHLPPNLLALFAPRPALDFLPPANKLPWDKDRTGKYAYDGVGDCLHKFEKAADQPLPIREETREERKQRIRNSKIEAHKRQMQDDLLEWDPNKNKDSTVDPYKTLFVGRLDYNTTEKTLLNVFEQYGRILEAKIVLDKLTGQSRGYAFIEFDNEKDMRYAYKKSGNLKIDGKKVIVDVERGRTVQGWRPRKFGGGLGDTRKPKVKGEDKTTGNRISSVSLYDNQHEFFKAPTNKKYNQYDDIERGGGCFLKSHRDFTGQKDKKQKQGDRARFGLPRMPLKRTGLQYSRGGFDFGDGGFFGNSQRVDTRSINWKGNIERKGSGNRNHDEDLGGISRYDERYIPSSGVKREGDRRRDQDVKREKREPYSSREGRDKRDDEYRDRSNDRNKGRIGASTKSSDRHVKRENRR